jgi:hypothetical protein
MYHCPLPLLLLPIFDRFQLCVPFSREF